MQKLSERIKHIAEQMNIPQKYFATKMNVNHSLISKHFSGSKKITIDHLEIYAEIFKVLSKELLEDTYEWEDSEYQEITYFIPRKEQPYARASTESVKQDRNSKFGKKTHDECHSPITDKLSYLFGGVIATGVGVLLTNAIAKKASKNKKT